MINTSLGSASGTQAFAGPRDDSFFIDLEAAFCILPDRKPVGGRAVRTLRAAGQSIARRSTSVPPVPP
jgi:hypothetical protein